MLAVKTIKKRISVTCVDTIQIQHWKFIYPIPIAMTVCLLCTFHIRLLTIRIFLEIDNFIMATIILGLRAISCTIVHVCFPI